MACESGNLCVVLHFVVLLVVVCDCRFAALCEEAYITLRRKGNLFITLFAMMLQTGECIQSLAHTHAVCTGSKGCGETAVRGRFSGDVSMSFIVMGRLNSSRNTLIAAFIYTARIACGCVWFYFCLSVCLSVFLIVYICKNWPLDSLQPTDISSVQNWHIL